MLPAAAANAAPIVAARLPGLRAWNTPLDGGRRYRGQPLLGSHKTWRGIVSGIVLATIVLWLQQLAVARSAPLQNITAAVGYARLPTWLLGPLFGLGALGGDAVKSFFKRRHGTRAGGSWLPFDQLDYIIGAIAVSLPFVVLSLRQYALIVAIWFAVHVCGTYLAWRVGLKQRPI